MTKVLGIGEVVLDKSYILSEYPKEDTKNSPLKVKYSVGGPVPTGLILLSRLGIECDFYASYGMDHEGELIQRKLAQEGVRLSGEKKKRTKVNTYLINSQNGSRTGIKSEVKYSLLERVPLDLLRNADLILIDRHEPKAFQFVLEHKKKETKIVIDPSNEYSDKTIEMIQNSDYPILPISLISGLKVESIESVLKDIYEVAKKPIIITAGKHGTLIFDGIKTEIIPSLKLQVIDTLGAGDVFRGAFAYGILNNWEIKETVKYANIVAGLQCAKFGNGSAIPAREEIERTLINPKFRKVRLEKVFRKL